MSVQKSSIIKTSGFSTTKENGKYVENTKKYEKGFVVMLT